MLLLCASIVACSRGHNSNLRGGVIEPPRLAADFTLNDQDGNAFTLSSTRGQLTLLYFGYTSCPDVCPMTLVDLAAVRKELGAAGKDVRVVFVTVDPERDTQEVLKRYVTAFDPSFVGLRGTPEELNIVLREYGAKAKKTNLPNSALGYAMDHSAFIYVIDRAGYLREQIPFGAERQDILNDVKVLLIEGV